MDIKVECYGITARLAGAAALALKLEPGSNVADALRALASAWPQLAEMLPSCACAVGDRLVHPSRVLAGGERLALLPPVSGG